MTFLGIDVGSTTVKAVALNENYQIIYQIYDRHYSRTREKVQDILVDIASLADADTIHIAFTGSAGLMLANQCNIPFVQEVFATSLSIESMQSDIDVVVELGGEDAKILFLTGGVEERMNGTCAGGTGAFIDQMATLLGVSITELDKLSTEAQKTYTIASRCGVFAKTDIQPLLNQGAKKTDIAKSIYRATVEQTIAGLAQGREITGKVCFLGGPLTFLSGLQREFVERLKLDQEHAIFPDNAQYYVAIGAALYASQQSAQSYKEITKRFDAIRQSKSIDNALEPLFINQEDYNTFVTRHSQTSVNKRALNTYCGQAYLGIDAGSTTTKLVLLSEDNEVLYSYYTSNEGNPVDVIKTQLIQLYKQMGDRVIISSSAVTGYGEELLKHAFNIDVGIVETVAHYTAAKYFQPNVDFIIDIGGQDIKCFKIKNNAVDSIMLNEACSSGCGSFIETFAKAWGETAESFANIGLFAEHPVDLGSRCTVFMNSSVKQAQNQGATMADISAGLSMSVVKNAIYKVIRANSVDELGKNIVVQGGTFCNDAILRSFEKELGVEVKRPVIAGLMGAFGAALYAKEQKLNQSNLLSQDILQTFEHEVKATQCNCCTNHCHLTINRFSTGEKYIAGNRCDRPIKDEKQETSPNLMGIKRDYFKQLQSTKGKRGRMGLPMGLNMYENLPFWYAFLSELGFEVVTSGESNRDLYRLGQHTIPSDTVCYPAKLLHGHIERLLKMNIDYIFYPCMSYNFDEKTGDNHYNCPVVAYYPELLKANIKQFANIPFYTDYFGLHRPRDFEKKAYTYFKAFGISKKEIAKACKYAYEAYETYRSYIKEEGLKAISYARDHQKPIVILAGRPYHVDPEINHGIDMLLTSFGFVVVTEDAVAHLGDAGRVAVLNQWTYHARLYNSAQYVTTQPDMQMIQLVSFGCGVDAITTDEVRDILERENKFYTQLKIDEISNLGSVKIRIRSLIAAMQSES